MVGGLAGGAARLCAWRPARAPRREGGRVPAHWPASAVLRGREATPCPTKPYPASAGKAACKRALQRELRFDPDPSAPLLGFVGRLDHQKGPDIILDALPALAALGCQVCGARFCLGSTAFGALLLQ